MRRTQRDQQILELLSLCVRVLTVEQIVARFYGQNKNGTADALKRLRQLPLELKRTVSHPILNLKEPLFSWQPGEPNPESFDRLSYRVQKRWDKPLCKTTFVTLAGARPVRATELSHDANVTQIFLTHFFGASDISWTIEDQLEWSLEKRPDALVCHAGVTPVAIDFGGAYPAHKFVSAHKEYSTANLAYQIW